MADLATSAIQAVRSYEHWHQEVDRLSGEIAGCECPREVPAEYDAVGSTFNGSFSCFREAKERLEEEARGPDGWPVGLRQIAAEDDVKACPSCSRLCVLIAERKVAKQKRGAAKRYVRRVGKMALREGEHA